VSSSLRPGWMTPSWNIFPRLGRRCPLGTLPLWESELSGLDARLATSIQLGGIDTAIADHLSKALSSQGSPDHPLVQEAMLL